MIDYGLVETSEGLQYHPESVRGKAVKSNRGRKKKNSIDELNRVVKRKEVV